MLDLDQLMDQLPRVTSNKIYLNNTNVFHPEGLFSEQIFGPVKDYECQCGKLEGRIYEGQRCDECGVECISSNARAHRLAVIELPFYIPKPYILLKAPTILQKLQKEYGEEIFMDEDPVKLVLAKFFKIEPSEINDDILRAHTTNKILVIPPVSRPLIKEKGKIITDRINNYYAILISIANQAKRKTQTVNNLLKVRVMRTPLFSELAQKLSSKQGFIRRYLLGKRIPGGRTVVTPDPYLPTNKIRIPLRIAVMLFLPLIINRLQKEYSAYDIYQACYKIFNREHTKLLSVIKATLQQLSQEYKVAINRQPTLHVSNIQAYHWELSETNTIQVSLGILVPFNADFDGDTLKGGILTIYDSEGNKVYEGDISELEKYVDK